MDMQNVIYAVAVLFIMGIVFAILLGVAAKVFAVEVDERVPLVRECLPGANCGGCVRAPPTGRRSGARAARTACGRQTAFDRQR